MFGISFFPIYGCVVGVNFKDQAMDEAFEEVSIEGTARKRPVELIFLLDKSGSMSVNGKIESLNTVMKDLQPMLMEEADIPHC